MSEPTNIVTQNPTITTVISMLVASLMAFMSGKVRSGAAADKQLLELRQDFQDRLGELREDFNTRLGDLKAEYTARAAESQRLIEYERQRAEKMTEIALDGVRAIQELKEATKRQQR